jgi:hypothetical protein
MPPSDQSMGPPSEGGGRGVTNDARKGDDRVTIADP